MRFSIRYLPRTSTRSASTCRRFATSSRLTEPPLAGRSTASHAKATSQHAAKGHAVVARTGR
jgi:hypothetical protein